MQTCPDAVMDVGFNLIFMPLNVKILCFYIFNHRINVQVK